MFFLVLKDYSVTSGGRVWVQQPSKREMEALAQPQNGKFIQLLSTAEIFIHSQAVKVRRQPSDIDVNSGDVCHFQESVYLTKKKEHIFCVSIEEMASNLNANLLRSGSGEHPLWRHWCISALSHLMNLNFGSDESSHYWMLLLIHLPYTYCLRSCSKEPTSLHPGPKPLLHRGGDAGSNAVAQEAQQRFRCGDKSRRRTAPTLHSVSPHLFVP